MFSNRISWNIGIKANINFWIDKWVDGQILASMFLRLYLLSEQKEEVIGGMGKWEEDKWVWELRWRRRLFEWQNVIILRLYSWLEGVHLHKDVLDSWSWKCCTMGSYTMKSTYSLLTQLGEVDIPQISFQLYGVFLIPIKWLSSFDSFP